MPNSRNVEEKTPDLVLTEQLVELRGGLDNTNENNNRLLTTISSIKDIRPTDGELER